MHPSPVDIAHSPRRNVVRITWDTGIIDELPVPYLRSWCPCAVCQGHGTTTRYHPTRAETEVEIEAMAEVGSYALSIRFSDGHDSGIFTWAWLHQIAPSCAPPGLKRGAFHAGTYQADSDDAGGSAPTT